MSSAVVQFIVSFILGLGSGYALQRAAFRTQEMSNQIEGICTEIKILADRGTEYWLLQDNDIQIPKLEAYIAGGQHWVQSAIRQVTQRLWFFQDTCEEELLSFMDAVTGGDFQVKGRKIDPGRSVDVQVMAAELTMKIKTTKWSIL